MSNESGSESQVTRTHKKIDLDLPNWQQNRAFMRAVLADLRAFERMLTEQRFEKGTRRIGAEQELFLTDQSWLPTGGVLKVLEVLKDPHFTTELGAFQLEMNADPQSFSGDGFSRLYEQMTTLVEKTRKATESLGMHAVLAGILPTLRKVDLGLDNMVPSPRYLALSKAVQGLRGSDFEIAIKGLDELSFSHDSVMAEACNSSFQVHLQVDADQFPNQYNLAQVLSAPLLSVACNSPLLFGKRLWAETRIALFQQSVDTRTPTQHLRDAAARVTFGSRWVKKSITEIFREDIARFRTLVGTDLDEDPWKVLDEGGTPQLKALRLHNGTIYRWNRACYGVIDGKPHLRIENRVMPSGPSIIDEIANAALWCGLMIELGQSVEDVTRHIDFDHAKGNFYTAAREGGSAHFHWLDGVEVSAQKLVLDTLLPAAEKGLRTQKVDEADIKKFLGVIDERVRTGRTGAKWLANSLHRMKDKGSAGERQSALVAAMANRQATGRPVAEWEHAKLDEAGAPKHTYQRVDQYMTTDIFTVHEEDPVDLVANIMGWERVRHVLVEDKEHKLIGLVSYRSVLRFLTAGGHGKDVAVREIMRRDVLTVTPSTATTEAITTMQKARIGCLPVLSDGKLLGVLTEENFMKIAGVLLERELKK